MIVNRIMIVDSFRTMKSYEIIIIFFSNFHFNNISITYNYTSHYLGQCTIGCHSGTKKINKIKKIYI